MPRPTHRVLRGLIALSLAVSASVVFAQSDKDAEQTKRLRLQMRQIQQQQQEAQEAQAKADQARQQAEQSLKAQESDLQKQRENFKSQYGQRIEAAKVKAGDSPAR